MDEERRLFYVAVTRAMQTQSGIRCHAPAMDATIHGGPARWLKIFAIFQTAIAAGGTSLSIYCD
jgi:hypothetical protein